MNWKNLFENTLIALLWVLIGAFIGYQITISTAKVVAQTNQEAILAAIDKPKEVNHNQTENIAQLGIKKIKRSDSLRINFNHLPTTTPILYNGAKSSPCDTQAIYRQLAKMNIKDFRKFKQKYNK